ncbi:MAG: hypothetical protein K8I27_05210 [Planctomycetes bacterium]|nr:hypothetical protein [Planctomycetota bacterium]
MSSLPRAALAGATWGVGAGVLLCLGAWLSPLAASDRPALALLAVTISLPLGCVVGRQPVVPREAGAVGLRAIVAALCLTAVVSLADPALFLRTASWCVAAGVIGVGAASLLRGAGVFATCFWLVLCALPFCYDKLPVLQTTGEAWAMQGCPWLGFSQDAFGGDPLRRPVLYLGHWSGLSSHTSMNLLQISTLWLACVPAFAAMILASGIPRSAITPEEGAD